MVTTGSLIAPVVGTLAPPTVQTRKNLRRKRRTKRQRFSGDDSVNGDNFWYYVEPGGGDGSNGGGIGFDGGSGGGSNWNSGGGFGGQNWDDSSSSPSWRKRFAFDFFYEVVYWIAVSKCVHFAIMKAWRAIL